MGYRKKKRRKKRHILGGFLLFLTAAYVLVLLAAFPGSSKILKSGEGILDKGQGKADMSSLYSASAVLVQGETGETLGEKKGGKRIYPASLTKMMTVLVVLENQESLDKEVRIPEEIFPSLYQEEASMAGFLPGEHVTVRDLLYGAMLPSGGECCVALAWDTAGSEEAFADKMNDKAKELKMNHTHFVNSTGLQDRDHYTTPEDLARLLAYAWQNENFRIIFTAKSYTVPPTDGHPEGFTFYNLMFQEMEESGISSPYILGGKTGYTSDAGLCLASVGQVNGETYFLVTAKANGSHETQPYHILDAVSVYQELGDSGT